MLQDITKKLKQVLENPIPVDEPRLIYILSCMRKIFDYDQRLNSKYKNLRFYCNWAFHVEIKKENEILEELRPYIKEALVKNSPTHGNLGVEKLISHFKKDFPSFLDELKFSKICYDDLQKQKKFAEILFGILKDVPLILTEKIEFRISNVENSNPGLPLGWQAKILP